MGICKNYLSKAKLSKKRLFTDNAKNESSDRKATVFAWFMEDGKVNDLNLLENSSKGRILSLTSTSNDILVEEVQNVHPVKYDRIIQKWLEMLLKRHVVLLALRV